MKRLGWGTTTYRNIADQRYELFSLKDYCMVKGNEWPTFMFDSFEITVRVRDDRLIVDPNPATTLASLDQYYVEFSKVEMHITYFDVTDDEVRAIREQAKVLESSGDSKFGLAFMTRKI